MTMFATLLNSESILGSLNFKELEYKNSLFDHFCANFLTQPDDDEKCIRFRKSLVTPFHVSFKESEINNIMARHKKCCKKKLQT